MGARTWRLLATALAITGLMAVMVGVAAAQEPYPPTSPAEADVQKEGVAPGDIQRITLDNLQPGSEATLVVTGPDGAWTITMTETVGADGTVVFAFRIPSDSPEGTAEAVIEAIDEDGNAVTFVLSFVIDASLPITGAGLSRMAVSSALLLLTGLGLVLIARRRRLVETAITG